MGRGTGAREQLAQGLDGLGGENVLGGAAETIDELDFDPVQAVRNAERFSDTDALAEADSFALAVTNAEPDGPTYA